MAFVSVIVPTYNRKEYICRCIDSILEQTYKDFELIVIDDGSDDGTEKICDAYGARNSGIKVIHQKNGGVSKARNSGIKYAGGKFCIFVDSDDYLLKDYLQQMVEAYEKFGDDYIYVTSFKVFAQDYVFLEQYKKSARYTLLDADEIIELMDRGLFNSPCNKLYRTEILKECNIRFPERMSLGEDLVFNLRYVDKCEGIRFVTLNWVLYQEWCKEQNSLESIFREDYFEIQSKLVKKKVNYICKWIGEGKMSESIKMRFPYWHVAFVKASLRYYSRHIKDMGVLTVVNKYIKILNSHEFRQYRMLKKADYF